MRSEAKILKINGNEIPAPDEGFEIIESDLVSSARNVKGVVVGQRIITIWKINNLQWSSLLPDEWRHIKLLLKPFNFVVEFIDDYGEYHKAIMYPGDRSATPHRANPSSLSYEAFKKCKVNLIDTGKEV